jgi:hypothetical protein
LNEFLQRVPPEHSDFQHSVQQLIHVYRSIDDPIRAQEWEAKLAMPQRISL